jgi:hypothetical protein
MKLAVVHALCKCEAEFPVTELAVMFHALLHVPDCIYRWNSVRNFWSFFGERCMGYFIRFIHNRDLAAENIMTAYCRSRFILDAYPGAVFSLLAKVKALGLQLPKRSTITSAAEILKIRGDLPGDFKVSVKPTKRNCSPRQAERGLTNRCAAVLRQLHTDEYKPQLAIPAVVDAMIKGMVFQSIHYTYHAHFRLCTRICAFVRVRSYSYASFLLYTRTY